MQNLHTQHIAHKVVAKGHSRVHLGDVIFAGDTSKEQKCLQSLKTSTYERFKDVNPSRAPETCLWAFDHDQFVEWKHNEANDLLWISADPGCGKSVLSKGLIDDLLASGGQTVCYFFFKDNDEQDNLSTALCAVLHQLFASQPQLIHHAIPAWENNGESLRKETAQLWRILQAAMQESKEPVFCVFDALDECIDRDRAFLLDLLCEFYKSRSNFTQNQIKFLITSRPYDSVQRWLNPIASSIPQIRLRGEDENDKIGEEINLVVVKHVDEICQEFNLPEHIQKQLESLLLSMKHRTYLWLYLAVEGIREAYRDSFFPDEVEIETLPASVEEAYDRLLNKISHKNRDMVKRVLLIIVGARRALTVEEMAKCLALSRTLQTKALPENFLEAERLARMIRQMCGLFVFINQSKIFLIHQTAKEFLLSDSPSLDSASLTWKSCFTSELVSYEMSRICTKYLSMYYPNLANSPPGKHHLYAGSIDEGDTFHRYCSAYWNIHLKATNLAANSELLREIVNLHDIIHVMMRMSKSRPRIIRPRTDGPNLWIDKVHLIGRIGCSIWHTARGIIVEYLSEEDRIDLEEFDPYYRTTLLWAIEKGHKDLVNLLILKGADINAEVLGDARNHPLVRAAKHGQVDITRILLERRVDDGAQRKIKLAIATGASYGHTKVVDFLLDWLNPTAEQLREETLRSSVALAAGSGHLSTVRLLLERGFDANSECEQGTALALSVSLSQNGFSMVQLLVEAGADVNATRDGQGSALLKAVKIAKIEVIRLLLDLGADVNLCVRYLGSPLSVAVREGKALVVEMLLNAGANPLDLSALKTMVRHHPTMKGLFVSHVESKATTKLFRDLLKKVVVRRDRKDLLSWLLVQFGEKIERHGYKKLLKTAFDNGLPTMVHVILRCSASNSNADAFAAYFSVVPHDWTKNRFWERQIREAINEEQIDLALYYLHLAKPTTRFVRELLERLILPEFTWCDSGKSVFSFKASSGLPYKLEISKVLQLAQNADVKSSFVKSLHELAGSQSEDWCRSLDQTV